MSAPASHCGHQALGGGSQTTDGAGYSLASASHQEPLLNARKFENFDSWWISLILKELGFLEKQEWITLLLKMIFPLSCIYVIKGKPPKSAKTDCEIFCIDHTNYCWHARHIGSVVVSVNQPISRLHSLIWPMGGQRLSGPRITMSHLLPRHKGHIQVEGQHGPGSYHHQNLFSIKWKEGPGCAALLLCNNQSIV